MTKWIRVAYLIVAWLFVIGVLIQVFLAGLSLFSASSYWATHVEFGYNLGFLMLLLLLLAFLGRFPRPTIGWTALLFVVYAVQTLLPPLRGALPLVAALHPVNALFVFWLAITVARRAREFVAPPLGTGAAI